MCIPVAVHDKRHQSSTHQSQLMTSPVDEMDVNNNRMALVHLSKSIAQEAEIHQRASYPCAPASTGTEWLNREWSVELPITGLTAGFLIGLCCSCSHESLQPWLQPAEFGCSHLRPRLHQPNTILYMTAAYLQPWLQHMTAATCSHCGAAGSEGQ